jgi:hypothetical protein
MCRILITAFALTFLLSSNASAVDSTSTTAPKSRSIALTRSQAWTLMPVATGGAMMCMKETRLLGLGIASLGLILGPGAGHAYAGKTERFWRGVAIRGIVASFTGAVAYSAADNSDFGVGIIQAAVALVVGGGICLVSAVHDISTVGTSVDEYNREHGFSSLTVKPIYMLAQKAPGLMLTLSF